MPPTAVARLPKVPMPLGTAAVPKGIGTFGSRATAVGGGAAAEGTDAFGHGGRVSMDYRNVIQFNPQFIGDDLRKGRLLPLAMQGCARQDGYFSIGLHLHFAVLP